MQVGRNIYYDKGTGNVIVDTGERQGSVVETTTEQDFEVYTALSERNPETVGKIELEYGQYSEDFMGSSGYRVNLDTLELEFDYTEPDEPEEFQQPFSVQVANLISGQKSVISAVQNILKRIDDLTEEEIKDMIDVYPEWIEFMGTEIEKGTMFKYEGVLYKVIINHEVKEQFKPDEADYYYTLVFPDEVIPYWEKPGYENTYSIGDKVIYRPDGKIYISQIDNNAEEPTKDEPHNRYWVEE